MSKKRLRTIINPDLIPLLVREFNINSIILFGSQARNDEDQFSDIDLLIVTSSIEAKKDILFERKILDKLSESDLPEKAWLNLAVYSKNDFKEIYHRGSLFIAHILQEGIVLYDDGFYEQLTKEKFQLSEDELQLSLKIISNRLSITDDLQKFNNYYIRCLSNYFSISKNLAIIALAMHGKLSFSKNQVFSQFANLYPKHKNKLNELSKLKPFYIRNCKGFEVTLPFEPYFCQKKVANYREDIRQLLLEVTNN